MAKKKPRKPGARKPLTWDPTSSSQNIGNAVSQALLSHAQNANPAQNIKIRNRLVNIPLSETADDDFALSTQPAPQSPKLTDLQRALVRQVAEENWVAAAPTAENILKLMPQDPTTLQILGVCRFHAGALPAAMSLIRQAWDIQPDYPEAHHNLARILEKSGQFTDAEDHFTRALALRADYQPAHGWILPIAFDARGVCPKPCNSVK